MVGVGDLGERQGSVDVYYNASKRFNRPHFMVINASVETCRKSYATSKWHMSRSSRPISGSPVPHPPSLLFSVDSGVTFRR